MNDFERKLRQQAFRTPPPDLRAVIFGAEAKVITAEPRTWRDWFWPSPAAWGALAALWIVFAAISLSDRMGSSSPQFTLVRETPPTTSLLSYYAARDFSHVLDFPN